MYCIKNRGIPLKERNSCESRLLLRKEAKIRTYEFLPLKVYPFTLKAKAKKILKGLIFAAVIKDTKRIVQLRTVIKLPMCT